MKIRLVIKGDKTVNGENELHQYRTVDLYLTDGLIDTKHEQIVGVEVEPKGFDKYQQAQGRK